MWRRCLNGLPLVLAVAAGLSAVSALYGSLNGWLGVGEPSAMLVFAGLSFGLWTRQSNLVRACQQYSRAFDALATSPLPQASALLPTLQALVHESRTLQRTGMSYVGVAWVGALPCFGCVLFSLTPVPQTAGDYLLPLIFWLPAVGMFCVLPHKLAALQAVTSAHLLRLAEKLGAGDLIELVQPLPSDTELPGRLRNLRIWAWILAGSWLGALLGTVALGISALGMAGSPGPGMIGWIGATAGALVVLGAFCFCTARLAASAAAGVAGLHTLLGELRQVESGAASYQPLRTLQRLRGTRRLFHLQALGGAALALTCASVLGFPRLQGMPFGFFWWLASLRTPLLLVGLAVWLPALEQALRPGLDGLEHCLQAFQERIWQAEQAAGQDAETREA